MAKQRSHSETFEATENAKGTRQISARVVSRSSSSWERVFRMDTNQCFRAAPAWCVSSVRIQFSRVAGSVAARLRGKQREELHDG